MLSTFGGLLFGVTGAVGASLALWMTDPFLRRSRLVQGVIAGIGAAVPGLAVFAFLGQTASVDVRGAAGILAFVAVSSFALMCIRAKAHTANPSSPPESSARNGIQL